MIINNINEIHNRPAYCKGFLIDAFPYARNILYFIIIDPQRIKRFKDSRTKKDFFY